MVANNFSMVLIFPLSVQKIQAGPLNRLDEIFVYDYTVLEFRSYRSEFNKAPHSRLVLNNQE